MEHFEFVNECSSEAYQTFLAYFKKMLNYELIESSTMKKKIKALITALFRSQKWFRLSGLIESFITEKQELWQELFSILFGLCAKNSERAENYTEKEQYEKMINLLFSKL